MYQVYKKLVSISATIAPTTMANKKKPLLVKILYIYHLLSFKKITNKVHALLNLSNEINVIMLIYMFKLHF